MAKHGKHALAQQNQRALASNARHRAKVRGFENALIRKAAVSLTAGAYGMMRKHGVSDAVGGVPWKLPVWVGATLIEALTGSATLGNFAAGVSDSTMAIYVKDAIEKGTFVAGENELA